MFGGGEDGVDAVAEAVYETVALHAVLSLDVANDRLDSCKTLQPGCHSAVSI